MMPSSNLPPGVTRLPGEEPEHPSVAVCEDIEKKLREVLAERIFSASGLTDAISDIVADAIDDAYEAGYADGQADAAMATEYTEATHRE